MNELMNFSAHCSNRRTSCFLRSRNLRTLRISSGRLDILAVTISKRDLSIHQASRKIHVWTKSNFDEVAWLPIHLRAPAGGNAFARDFERAPAVWEHRPRSTSTSTSIDRLLLTETLYDRRQRRRLSTTRRQSAFPCPIGSLKPRRHRVRLLTANASNRPAERLATSSFNRRQARYSLALSSNSHLCNRR